MPNPHIFDKPQPPIPAGPPRSHKTVIMDGGWTISPGPHPITGAPAIGIEAVDGTELLIYPFDDVLTFATFRRHCETLAERFRSNAEAASQNGEPDEDA